MTWQPIETAPKDGTRIIVYDTRAGFTPWVRWGNDVNPKTGKPYGWMSEVLVRWGGNPTHWMPLPEPPK